MIADQPTQQHMIRIGAAVASLAVLGSAWLWVMPAKQPMSNLQQMRRMTRPTQNATIESTQEPLPTATPVVTQPPAANIQDNGQTEGVMDNRSMPQSSVVPDWSNGQGGANPSEAGSNNSNKSNTGSGSNGNSGNNGSSNSQKSSQGNSGANVQLKLKVPTL